MFDQITVLLVEDSQTIREATKEILESFGVKRVWEAENGLIALLRLKRLEVDLIISDWDMPKLNGLELLVEIKKTEKLKKIPFIILTGFGEKDKVIMAVKAGASDYMIKPVKPAILEKKVKSVLNIPE